MKRRLLLECIAVVVLVAVAGCASPLSRKPTVGDEERSAYAQALAAHDPAESERRLEELVRAWPNSPLAADASLRLGEMAQTRGDRAAALRHYDFVARGFAAAPQASAAYLRIAQLELEGGNEGAAEHAIARVRLPQLSDAERRLAYRLHADTEPYPVEKLRWLARLRRGETDAAALAALDVEIDEQLGKLDEVELAALADQLEPDIPAARALLTAAELAADAGELDRARRWLERASALPIAPAYSARLALAADRLRGLEMGGPGSIALPTFADAAAKGLPATADARGVLGVVLPLSGRFASFGEENLRGILLAAGVFDAVVPPDQRPTVRLLIRDTGGSAARAAEHVRELAQHQDVSAIIAGLTREECEAAAAAAEAAGIPLLALTGREQIAHDRAFVFRLLTMPSDEVQALAGYVMDHGAQRFGILYPRDRYGLGLSGLFWEAVEARGGRVVALAAYDPEATDFADPIRRLVGYELLTDAEKAVIKEREKMLKDARRLPTEQAAELREEARALLGPDDEPLPPIVDFDALFIPESYEKLVLIAPQLAFHEATGAQLLGADGWNHPDLVSIGGSHVEGSLFSASFYVDSPVDFVHYFSRRYEATYGTPATDMAAQAYDAATIALVQLARGASARTAMRQAVLHTRGFPGASGVLTMGPDGNARKRPFLLSVQRGRLVQVN